jgi:putative transposase
MLLSHKIALDLNNKQKTYMSRASGVARFAYNWALEEWGKQYAEWKRDNSLPKPNQLMLRRQLNGIKRKAYPWMLEVTKCAPQEAIIQLGKAFQNFFTGRAKYPKFRKKGVHDRFTLSNGQFSVRDIRIRIPNLGWVRMRERLRFTGKIMSATISRTADKWYVSITVDTEHLRLREAENQGEAVGVDLGVKLLAVLSNGEVIAGAKAHKVLLKRLQRLSRGLSRKAKGSKNREKARVKLARLHAKIVNIRQDALHKLTTDLTTRFQIIGIEDLNVSGMLRNRRLSRSIADMSFFEFKRQLEYKADMRGGKVIEADRFFASSKICSSCGHKLEQLPLSVREWECPECGKRHDRDINAAINLRQYAVSSTVSACGAGSADFVVRQSETTRYEAGNQH